MECKQSLVAKLSHQLEHVIRISRTKPWTYKPNTILCPDELFCSSSKASSLPSANPFPSPLFYIDKLSSTLQLRRRDRYYYLQLDVTYFKLKNTKQKGLGGGSGLLSSTREDVKIRPPERKEKPDRVL